MNYAFLVLCLSSSTSCRSTSSVIFTRHTWAGRKVRLLVTVCAAQSAAGSAKTEAAGGTPAGRLRRATGTRPETSELIHALITL